MTLTITHRKLRAAGACHEQLDLFKKTFGESVTFAALDAFKDAVTAHPFDYEWAARHLLTPPAYAEYERVRDAAFAEYARVRNAAHAEYKRVRDAAFAEYRRVHDAAAAEHERVHDAAAAEYRRVRDTAFAEYRRVHNAAFASAFWKQEAQTK